MDIATRDRLLAVVERLEEADAFLHDETLGDLAREIRAAIDEDES